MWGIAHLELEHYIRSMLTKLRRKREKTGLNFIQPMNLIKIRSHYFGLTLWNVFMQALPFLSVYNNGSRTSSRGRSHVSWCSPSNIVVKESLMCVRRLHLYNKYIATDIRNSFWNHILQASHSTDVKPGQLWQKEKEDLIPSNCDDEITRTDNISNEEVLKRIKMEEKLHWQNKEKRSLIQYWY